MQPWSALDDQAVTTSRALAMDAVQKVGNGHPGTAMSLAPVAYTLFQRILKHDPSHPDWIARDRFILSCGHSSLTLYIQLFLSGYGVELDDLKSFRTYNALTPGHPEYGHTLGVETTTGPLGQGVANAVGMAMASRYEKGLLDPENKTDLFDHNIWVICSDGDLQEGVSAEASSLAGTQQLGNLKVIYDDNRISIEGDTHVAFDEDVSARYKSYGWEVFEVSAKHNGDVDREKLEQIMEKALLEKDKPVLIRLHSVIAWPAPSAQGTAESHGSALGADEVSATKKVLGLNPDESFVVPAEVLDHARKIKERGAKNYQTWQVKFSEWQSANNDKAELLRRLINHELPANWAKNLPVFSTEKEIATRAASGKVIQEIAKALPEFWGGSADLAGSNNTTIEGGNSFLPATSQMKNAHPHGRIIHFGIREHAMGAILNGIALHGLAKPFAGTFLVFSDYMRGAVRLSAIMKLPITYVWSHDSIGLGEDGPTHQPVEHLATLRAIPDFAVIRPADANEVSIAWREIITRAQPVGLALSRQNLPVIDRTQNNSAEGLSKGAYVLNDSANNFDVILIATGSEVSLALKSQAELVAQGIATRVVSAPCLEWFEQQDQNYKEKVLPKSVKARVSIEAGIAMPWYKFIGDYGVAVSLEHFGASASATTLFKEFGFTVENVVNAAKQSIANSK
ncbi:MAG: transketolase [Actinobacteria bacterium]|uniref:transketolase n=1 Tax=freshwater metagenome TaxID=449393 RepID=A0A6J6GR22_9ZZZZ|nr:transketolase [Actinomycetota bacterium]